MNTNTRRDFIKTTFALGAGATLALPALDKLLARAVESQPAPAPQARPRPNILFIICDDLRTELGCYGCAAAITPNIDRLAASGVRFNNAYCQAPMCGPSRSSMLSGLRPSVNGYTDNEKSFRKLMPNVETLPEFFGRNGYTTIGLGKIYHDSDIKPMAGTFNAKAATPPAPAGLASEYKDPANQKQLADYKKKMLAKHGPDRIGALALGPVCEFYDAPEESYQDAHMTTAAIATMKQLAAPAASGKPFFLGVGYRKPHLSFIAPKKYWDMYEGRDIPLPANNTPPKGAPSFTLSDSFEVRARYGVPKYGPFTPEYQRYLLRGYLACVSFIDAQVGRLIDGLRDAGLADNTIIIFCADHGWHLGEMGVWGKATDYEVANHVPLLIVDPRIGTKGVSYQTTEYLNIYPTLADLAGFPVPESMAGRSLKSALENPSEHGDMAAISQFPCPALREWAGVKVFPNVRREYFDHALNDIESRIRAAYPGTPLDVFQENVMGYTIRDNRHRYVVWVDQSKTPWKIIATELYDHERDTDETLNLANVAPTTGEIKSAASKLEARMWKTLGFEDKF